MKIYLVSIGGEPIAEFDTPYTVRPDIIVWQTRGFVWCEKGGDGQIYEEVDTIFMPPQFEVMK